MSIQPKARVPFFTSAKTRQPVPADTRMRTDALVQASLDPAVFEIDYVPAVAVEGVDFPLGGIVFVAEHDRHLLDLPDDGPTPDFDQEGLMLLAIETLGLPVVTRTVEDLNRQPFAGNCRLIWRMRSQRVHPGDRVRILDHLEENGPCRLVDVAAVVRSSSDGVSAVLALACQDLLELDLFSAPFGPWTTVRRRRQREGG